MSSFTINRVVLVGRLTRDPELRSLPSGSTVCNVRIACNSVRRDTEGEYQEKPNFFDVDVFGGHAESVNKYTRKGSRVAVDGRLEWREWETPDNQKRQMVSVVGETVLFLDSPGGGQSDDHSDDAGDDANPDRRSDNEERQLAPAGAKAGAAGRLPAQKQRLHVLM